VALNGLYFADVPFSNYSLTHPLMQFSGSIVEESFQPDYYELDDIAAFVLCWCLMLDSVWYTWCNQVLDVLRRKMTNTVTVESTEGITSLVVH